MTQRTGIRIGALVVSLAMCAAAWAVLAPPELGGSTRWVVTDGSSMEPGIEAGDLALVRTQQRVEQGDVVLYENPRLGAHVLHRIVRVGEGRYVLKGDNNGYLDAIRPGAEQIDGKLWFVLPRVGSALAWMQQPVHAALLVFALAFFALGGSAAFSGLRRSRHSPAPAQLAPQKGPSGDRAGVFETLLAVGLAGFAISALLALVSYSRETTRLQSLPDAYAHVGEFTYGADVESSDVYPDGHVSSGEAVFVSLVRALDVEFAYLLDAENARGVRGTTELHAVLSDGAGWTREIPLAEPTPFSGPTARVAGVLDVGSLADVVEEMRALTGSGTSTFALGVTADVAVRGRVGDERIRQRFSPELPLLFDSISLRPDSDDGSRFEVRAAKASTVAVPAPLVLGGVRLSIEDARRMSLLGLVLAAILAALGSAAVWRTRTGGELSQIASLFGDRLITISRPPSGEPGRVTELRDAESLVRLAEHRNRVVLHWREGRDHVYEVEDGSSIFRYRAGLGLEPGCAGSPDDEDTLILPPTKLPPRAVAG